MTKGILSAERLAYAAVCLAMWPLPLLNRLHVESAAILAAATFIIAGLAALHGLRGGVTLGVVLTGRLIELALPLILMLVPMAWAPNCGWKLGVGFFLLFPAITAVFAVAIAAVISRQGVKRSRTLLVGAGALIAIAGPIYDLGFHPQFYTYNHVFGGVLGPIYDEELALRPGLFVFRGVTLAWALLGIAWWYGRQLFMAGAALLIVFVYLLSGRLGINTGYSDLERALPGALETEHFSIHFDPEHTDSLRLRAIRDLHEHEYNRLSRVLDVEVGTRIHTFVYPDAETRAALTGARNTSVAPVWLSRPQVHVEDATLELVFPHELVHAFSREFGLPLLNASVSVGLVEGLAVALEPPSPRPSTDDLVAVARAATGLDSAKQLPSVLSPFGFWTGRGGVSYTVTGSFVSFLLREFGASPLKRAYAWSSMEREYNTPLEALVERWQSEIDAVSSVDAGAVGRARLRLGAPSLFERRCPHWIPEHLRLTRLAWRALDDGDESLAVNLVIRALALAPGHPAVLAAYVQIQLETGSPDNAWSELHERDVADLPASLALVKADLLAAQGDSDGARVAYQHVLGRLPLYARQERMATALRIAAANDSTAARVLTNQGEAAESVQGRVLVAFLDPAGSGTLPEAPPDGLPRWARQLWPAHYHASQARRAYRDGHLVEAARSADHSGSVFEAVGDLTMARYVRHVADRYRFAEALPLLP